MFIPDNEGGSFIPKDLATLTNPLTGKTAPFIYLMGYPAMATAAIAAGVTPGERFSVRYYRYPAEFYTLTPSGGGDRTPGGCWVEKSLY